MPSYLWRTFYECYNTISRYIAWEVRERSDSSVDYIKEVQAIINDNNAFQARESFALEQDTTKKRIRRHLNWHDDTLPYPSFVFAFEDRSMFPVLLSNGRPTNSLLRPSRDLRTSTVLQRKDASPPASYY
jgi:hypothetical protein